MLGNISKAQFSLTISKTQFTLALLKAQASKKPKIINTWQNTIS